MRNLVGETSAQLNVCKKGEVIEMIDAGCLVMLEAIESEQYVAKTSTRIGRLNSMGRHWIKDFLENQILFDVRGCDEREREKKEIAKLIPKFQLGMVLISLSTQAFLNLQMFFVKNICILKDHLKAALRLEIKGIIEDMLQERSLKDITNNTINFKSLENFRMPRVTNKHNKR